MGAGALGVGYVGCCRKSRRGGGVKEDEAVRVRLAG